MMNTAVARFGDLAPRLAANGFEPVPVIPGEKRPRPPEWQRGGFAERAAEFSRDYTGILTRWTPAVDIDVSDPELVRQIENVVLDVLDCHERPPPARVGMAPRRLLVFRTDEPFAKLQTAAYRLPSDPVIDGKQKPSKVEVLGDGQQFVAYAIHPDTRAPYTWNGGGEPLDMQRAVLIPLEREQAAEIIRRADALLAANAGAQPAAGKADGERAAEHADPATITDLRSALNALDSNDRDLWISVGHALRRLGDIGRELWVTWSQQSPKWTPADAQRWEGFRPTNTGYAAVFAKAQACGWVNPRSREAAVFGQDGVQQIQPPERSDDHLALEFVAAFGGAYRWSPGLGWMADAGIVWKRDEALTRYDLARRICRAAALGAKPEEQKRLTSAKTVGAVLSLAQSDQSIGAPAAAWDGNPMLLNTPGGIVDLRTATLRLRTPDDLVTQAAQVTPDFACGCEVFEDFLQDVFMGDNDLIDFVQRMLGYCLTGDRREQVLFFWHGSGSNAKSTLLDLVLRLLDSYAVKLPSAALMVNRNERHPTELAQLRGKRLAISSELDEGQFWNESLIKELTGDEVMTARFMRQDFFEFAMTQKHIIVGNHKPRLRGGDPAMARRLVLVPFEAVFDAAKRDRDMPAKLWTEAPAILAWMIRGAVRWQRDGLRTPTRVRDASAEYLADHDDLALWLDECCVRDGEAKASELYSSFRHWKEQRGEHAPSQTTWGQRLQALPGVSRRKSSGIRYAGLRLNDREEHRVRSAA